MTAASSSAFSSSGAFLPPSNSRLSESRKSRFRHNPAPSTLRSAAGAAVARGSAASRRRMLFLRIGLVFRFVLFPRENPPFHAGVMLVEFSVLSHHREPVGEFVFD